MQKVDTNTLAMTGGQPVRQTVLRYGTHWIDEDDIAAVNAVLRSEWLTTGPKVAEFERAFADFVGTRDAVVVSSGTAALHAAMQALDIGPGDEVIVPAMTFAASANCILYQGGIPVFADVDPETLLIDTTDVEKKITPRTKSIVAVDYSGHPADYDKLAAISKRYGLRLVADACHALGASYHGRPVGTLADVTAFSLHPVKHITSGEGGVIATDDPELANKMRTFRSHGITTDHRQRESQGSWFYEMQSLGYNYRLSDINCALALSQLPKLRNWVNTRQQIAKSYDDAFAHINEVNPLLVRPDVSHAYHLYVVEFDLSKLRANRATIFQALRAENIGVNVHYIPVHLHPFYKTHLGTGAGLCPVAEAAYERIITLPLFPRMTQNDVQDVIAAVRKVCKAYAR
jgi:perosamine synthetase